MNSISAEVNEWFSATMAKTEVMANKYNKKPCYFLDIFFHGGAHLVHKHCTTSWNAFLSKKADKVNGGKFLLTSNQENTNVLFNCSDNASNPMSLLKILQEHHDEDDGFSKEEKAKLV